MTIPINNGCALIDAVRARYPCTIDVYFPRAQAVEAMVRDHGVNLFYAGVERRKQCCGVRSPKRSLDCGPGSPGFGASTEDVWRHVRANYVPHNPLHDHGYPSIGCAPCTRPVRPGEDLRAGRWWWEAPGNRECGLHLPAVAATSS